MFRIINVEISSDESQAKSVYADFFVITASVGKACRHLNDTLNK